MLPFLFTFTKEKRLNTSCYNVCCIDQTICFTYKFCVITHLLRKIFLNKVTFHKVYKVCSCLIMYNFALLGKRIAFIISELFFFLHYIHNYIFVSFIYICNAPTLFLKVVLNYTLLYKYMHIHQSFFNECSFL